jgi:hypothetical protein
LLVLIAVVGGGAPAAAGGPDRPAAAAAGGADRPGRASFEMAETKFNLGRFEEAVVDYQAAYQAEPLPAFLFNIGQCYRNAGDYERAQFYFRRYVELDPRSRNRPDAERLIAEMERLAAEQRSTPVAAPTAAVAVTALPAVDASASPGSSVTGERAPPAFAPVVTRAGDGTATPRPLYRRPWFWIGGAAVVAAGIAAAVVITRDDRQPTLLPIAAADRRPLSWHRARRTPLPDPPRCAGRGDLSCARRGAHLSFAGRGSGRILGR